LANNIDGANCTEHDKTNAIHTSTSDQKQHATTSNANHL